MKSHIRTSLIAAAGAMFAFATTAAAAPFSVGDTARLGSDHGYNYTQFDTIGTGAHASFRFTATDDAAVSATSMGLYVFGAGSEVSVGLQADDGNGNPDGTWLSTPYTGTPLDRNDPMPFGSVNLVKGQVYHLVTHVNEGSGRIRHGGVDPTGTVRRAYDHSIDPNWRMLSGSGGSWNELDAARHGFYALMDDSGNYLPGFGQPYTQRSASLTVAGADDQRRAQRFYFNENVLATGTGLLTNTLEVGGTVHNNPTASLTVSVKDDNGNILAQTLLGPETHNTMATLTLDQEIILWSGQVYWIEMSLEEETSSQQYRMFAYRTAGSGTGEAGEATWGGDTDIAPYRSTDGGLTWELNSNGTDLAFAFTGEVIIPEPASLMLLAGGSLLALVRRRRA